MRIIGLIPARGGSKGIPRKNIVPLGGRPLLAWTIDAATQAGCIEAVYVSTDDEEIAQAARRCGSAVIRRPAEHASDTASALAVMRHALAHIEEGGGEPIDALVYLQPTSPFRRENRIREAVDRFVATRADVVVTVCRVPHNMLAGSQFELLPDGTMSGSTATGPLNRQQKRELWVRNGPAVLVAGSRYLRSAEGIYAGRVVGLPMDRFESLDIDDRDDLKLAELLAPEFLAGRMPDSMIPPPGKAT